MVTSGSPTPLGYGPGVWQMVGRGVELGAIIGGMTYLGYLGDEWFGTGPWLMLAGALLATVGGSYNLAKSMLWPGKRKALTEASRPEKDKS